MEQTVNYFLGREPVGRLMMKYAVPCMISLLVGALYNIVDQIFIANASYLGSYGNAANTVVFPLTVIALAIAVMIGDGSCAFVSLSLGREQPQDAKKSVGNAVVMSVAGSILLCALYLISVTRLLQCSAERSTRRLLRVQKNTFSISRLAFRFICSVRR